MMTVDLVCCHGVCSGGKGRCSSSTSCNEHSLPQSCSADGASQQVVASASRCRPEMLYRRLTGSHRFSLRWTGWLEVGHTKLGSPGPDGCRGCPQGGCLLSVSSGVFLLLILLRVAQLVTSLFSFTRQNRCPADPLCFLQLLL